MFREEIKCKKMYLDVVGILQIVEYSGQIERRFDPSFSELMNFIQFFKGFIDLEEQSVVLNLFQKRSEFTLAMIALETGVAGA